MVPVWKREVHKLALIAVIHEAGDSNGKTFESGNSFGE